MSITSFDASHLTKSRLSIGDDVGVVYIGNSTIYRAIKKAYESHVTEILECGLLSELSDNQLFPKTTRSSVEIQGCRLVLEHEKVNRVIYPFEWSPEMLRSAATCVLRVNSIANKYGYQLKDAHPYNVLFRYNKPLYVDLGSFIKLETVDDWVAYNEFKNCYVMLLQLIPKGLVSVFKRAFILEGRGYEPVELAMMSNTFYKLVGARITAKVQRLLSIYRRGPTIKQELIDRRFKNLFIRHFATFVLRSRLLPRQGTSTAELRKQIDVLDLNGSSLWGNYYNPGNILDEDGTFVLTTRFKWITKQIEKLDVSTVTDMAGNQGLLARALSVLPKVREVTCIDYDEKAIDALHRALSTEHIYPACFDFMRNVTKLNFPEDNLRFKSDIVLALALTHHLTLTQGFNLDSVFRTLATYTNRYLMVEFMPLGLWDGTKAPPVPDWYTEDWFALTLRKHFNVICREQLEPNRICFVAELKRSNTDTPMVAQVVSTGDSCAKKQITNND